MAHITIYGITDSEEFSHLEDTDFCDDTYAHDHYDGWRNREEDPKVLAEELSNLFSDSDRTRITVGEDAFGWYIEFTQEAIDLYFLSLYSAFRNHVCDLMKVMEPDMMKVGYIPALWGAEHVFSDDTGSMLFDWTNGWLTPQDFMRLVEPGVRYYITGAVDAHCWKERAS